jgi:Lectin C-type domain/Gametolysin peptidase M11
MTSPLRSRFARRTPLLWLSAVGLLAAAACEGAVGDDGSRPSPTGTATSPSGLPAAAGDAPAAPGPTGEPALVDPAAEPELGTDELEGLLEVYVTHFDDGSAPTTYELVSDQGTRHTLSFAREPLLATGDLVRVVGVAEGDARFSVQSFSLLNDDDEGTPSVQALTNNATRQTGKVAALLVHWGTPDSLTADQLKANLFSSSTSAAEFHKEASYNLNQLTGDVYGWLQVPAMANCDTKTLATNAQAAAKAAGIDLTGYSNIAYYFPKTSQCSWAGLAYVGRPKSPARESWYNGAASCGVLAHELGHNIGAQHARSYDCGASALGAAAGCTYSEYGDPYDVMGSGQCTHPSTYLKAAEGWFGGCNVVTATSSGSFDITPLELPSNALQSLRVPMDASLCPSGLTSCYYYVDFRQALGKFDSKSPSSPMHQGVLVHVGSAVDFTGNGRPQVPYLLDMTPGSRSSDFTDAALTPGKTFTDSTGLSIRVDSIAASAARVTVTLPGGGAGAPTCTDGSTYGGGTSVDAGVPGGGVDAGVEGGVADGGVADGGVRDAGVVDAGVVDAGVVDAGAPADAGGSDAGSGTPSDCPAGTSAFGGHCYAAAGSALGFDAALSSCNARGAGWGLAEVSSASENQFVSSLIGTRESWLGATDRSKEGTWSWLSGTSFWGPVFVFFSGPVNGRFTSFVSGEPNDGGGNSDCLRMVSGGGWRDGNCADTLPSVCER